MTSYKMRKMNGPVDDKRRLKCTKCGVVMQDIEPNSGNGSFYHPDNGCDNAGKHEFDHTYSPRTNTSPQDHGLVAVLPKKMAREQKRGARAASKHRPR